MPIVALADTVNVNFENPPYTVGTINNQDGWTSTGAYDQGVVSSPVIAGSQSFRISNAVTSGAFGDQTFSKPLTNSAGETGSDAGGFTQGTLQSHFESQFTIQAIANSIGDIMSVSPDTGNGGRMSYLRFDNEADGIHVYFDDVQGTSSPANFVETEITPALNSATAHTVKFSIDFVSGPSNDVVKIYIDGNLVHTGTTWENYYRFDPESNPSAPSNFTHSVRSMLFRAGGAAVPANSGKGFLIDDLSLMSGATPASNVTVTIVKDIDGVHATSANAATSSFPMMATWNATNIGAGSGTYTLSPVGFNNPNAYEATTADMTSGASYSTNEDTSGTTVAAGCASGKPFALVGYTTGDSLAAAQAGTPTTTVPALTNITTNKFIIVWNTRCVTLPAPVNVSPANGATLTSAAWTKADWTDVTDAFPPISYLYESSNASTTNPDGSFTTPAYQSGALSVSEIPTTGTPEGTWYWHARAQDSHGNQSAWSAFTKVIVSNATTTPPPPSNACDTPGVAPAGYTLRNGTFGNDTVTLSPFTMFVGMGGNDKITGANGNFIVCGGGGNGNSQVTLGNGDATIVLGNGNQKVTVGDGKTVIMLGNGNQNVSTGNGDKMVTTGTGNDTITTGSGNDTINAGDGNNTVSSGAGNDTITAGNGNDKIDGGANTDSCNAGGGRNTVTNCE